ncbi:hypothetical protein [Streptomyces phaeofaciens]
MLQAFGFTDIEFAPAHPVADGMHSAIAHAEEQPAEYRASD